MEHRAAARRRRHRIRCGALSPAGHAAFALAVRRVDARPRPRDRYALVRRLRPAAGRPAVGDRESRPALDHPRDRAAGAAPVARGPYRWLRHPNYVVVVLEIAVVPLALGLPLFALVFSLANTTLLAYRIRVENQALAWTALATNNGGSEISGSTLSSLISVFDHLILRRSADHHEN